MTNNPTIDGVSRELVECDACPSSGGCVKTCMKSAPAVERQEPKTSQVPVLRAMAVNYRNGHSWDFLDGEVVSKAADEITALQSTIAQLQARVQELESGRGDVIHQVRTHGSDVWEDISGESLELCQCQPEEYEIRKLYTDPPAPVAVVLPERKPVTVGLLSESNTRNKGWNACLDATAALNEVRK